MEQYELLEKVETLGMVAALTEEAYKGTHGTEE